MRLGTDGKANMQRVSIRSPARQRGQALIEYTLVTFLVVVVLIANPNVITEIVDAIRSVYQAFTSAISVSYIPEV